MVLTFALHCLISFLIGGFFLCFLSAAQKIFAGFPIVLKGFIVPMLFGGMAGLLVCILTKKLIQRTEKLKQVLEYQMQDKEKFIESEERYRMLAENANDIIFRYQISPKEGYTYINPAVQRILGYTPKEVMEDPDIGSKTIHPNSSLLLKKIESGNVDEDKEHIFQIYSKKGDLLQIATRYTLLRNEKGVLTVIEGISRDITQQKQAEKALRESEMKYRAIFNSITSPMHVLDADFRITMANKKLLEMENKTEEEIIGKLCYEILKGKKERCELCAVQKAIKTGKPATMEDKYFLANGSLGYFNFFAYPIFDENGELVEIVKTTTDITEIKKAERLLRFQRNIAQAQFDWQDMPRIFNKILATIMELKEVDCGGIYLVDKNSGALDLAAQINLPQPFIKSASRFEADSPQAGLVMEGKPIHRRYDDVLPGEKDSIRNGEGLRSVAIIPIKHEGRVIAAINIASHTQNEIPEDVRFFLETASAQIGAIITKIKLQQSLRESEEQYRLLAENASDNIWVLRLADLRFTYISPSVTKIFGYTPEESMAMELDEHMPPDALEKMSINLAQELENENKPGVDKNRYRTFEIEQYIKGGGTIWTEITTSFIRDDHGKPESILGITRDISKRKKAEEEKAKLEDQLRHVHKMEAIGRLAGGVAHDFNNILTGITGYTEMVQSSLDHSDPIYIDLEEVRKAAERAAGLTNQLLAFSRKQIIDPKVIAPNDILDNSQRMISRIIGEDIDFLFMPGKELWRIKADPSQLDQIFVNLAVNARDAMPGGGKLTVETQNIIIDEQYSKSHAGIKAGGFVMLAVTDTGCGMDAEILEHIFEPFYSTKDKEKGTGLGLATVYGIIKQNKGFINVYSEPERGTTFKIYFPAVMEEAERISPRSMTVYLTGTETVLLVEDEQMVRKLAKKVLTQHGYKIIDRNSAEEAFPYCENLDRHIDLLLTDVIMPGMNGRDLYVKLKEKRPDLKALFMSGYTENVIAHHGVLEKGTEFIQKPFTIEALARKVRKVLDN